MTPEEAAALGIDPGFSSDDYYTPPSVYVGDLPLDPSAGADQGLLGRFRMEAANFMNVYRAFTANSQAAYQLGLGGEYSELDGRASTAKSYVEQVSSAAGSAWGWAKSTFGLAGARRGVGALPIVVPIAAVAITAMLAWIVTVRTDLAKFNARVNALKAGVDPRNLPTDGGTAGDITSLLKWGVIAFIAFQAVPPIVQALGGKR